MLMRALILSIAMAAALRAACTSPGKERWDIKVSLPDGANMAKPKAVDLLDLTKLPNPPGVKNKDKRYESGRIPAFANPLHLKEGDLVTIKGYLFLIATEDNDCEYHIQLASKYPGISKASSKTPVVLDDCIIVEVALPKDIKDPKLSQSAAGVRQWLHDQLKLTSHGVPAEPVPDGNLIQHPVFVAVSGQLFYDDAHLKTDGSSQPRGKHGLRTNTLWELHPIFRIEWAGKN